MNYNKSYKIMRLRAERNSQRDKRNGIDFYAAGLGSDFLLFHSIKAGLAVQRMRHITKGLHWFTSEYHSNPTYIHGYWGFCHHGDLPF